MSGLLEVNYDPAMELTGDMDARERKWERIKSELTCADCANGRDPAEDLGKEYACPVRWCVQLRQFMPDDNPASECEEFDID